MNMPSGENYKGGERVESLLRNSISNDKASADNAKVGEKVENLFKNSIAKNEKGIEVIMTALGLSGAKTAKPYRTGTSGGKADVVVNFDGSMVAANIKSYSAGFNQATRMRLDSFADRFKLPDNISKILRDSIIRKAENRKLPFISKEDAPIIVEYFKRNGHRILEYSLCGEEKPQLFVLYNRPNNNFSVYLMEDILERFRKANDVSVTTKGVIRLNKYFTIQRKGGNGVRDKRDKVDLNHGGNNIQVKLKPRLIEQDFDPLYSYNP